MSPTSRAIALGKPGALCWGIGGSRDTCHVLAACPRRAIPAPCCSLLRLPRRPDTFSALAAPVMSEPGLGDTMQEVVQKIGEIHLRINQLEAEGRVLQVFAQDHHKRLVALEEVNNSRPNAPSPAEPPAAPRVEPSSEVTPPPELVQALGVEYRDCRIDTRELIELAYQEGHAAASKVP